MITKPTKADLEYELSSAQFTRERAITAVLRALVPPPTGAPSESVHYQMTPALSSALYKLKLASDWCVGAKAQLEELDETKHEPEPGG
jgi:hypothetical protein